MVTCQYCGKQVRLLNQTHLASAACRASRVRRGLEKEPLLDSHAIVFTSTVFGVAFRRAYPDLVVWPENSMNELYFYARSPVPDLTILKVRQFFYKRLSLIERTEGSVTDEDILAGILRGVVLGGGNPTNALFRLANFFDYESKLYGEK